MNWEELIESETKKDYFKSIKKVILSDSRNGKLIFPYPKNYFKALEFCSYEDLKVVILGQDPYHTCRIANCKWPEIKKCILVRYALCRGR